jgi:hypothetical protein
MVSFREGEGTMAMPEWGPSLKAITQERDRERSLERETEERARAFLAIAEELLGGVVLAHDTTEVLTDAAREGLSRTKAQNFIDVISTDLGEGALHFIEGKSGGIDRRADTLVKQVQSLELPAEKFIAVSKVVAPVIIERVSRRLQESNKLPSSTAKAVVQVAVQSLRAELTKPEYLKADAHLKDQQILARAARPA